MKKETKTKLLVALAVLCVWIYIEVEPVLSQNGGPTFFNQAQNQNPQAINGNFTNQQNLIPQGFLNPDIRSQQVNQGMPSMPMNGQPLPRRSDIRGTQAFPQAQQAGGNMPFMPTNSPFQNQQGFGQMPQGQAPQNPQGGLFQNLFNNGRQNNAPVQNPQQGFNQNQQGFAPAQVNQAVSSVQRELAIARSNAAQAEAYRSQAINLRDKGAKRRAAQESRYYANQARAAASRAQSKSMGVPQAMSLVSQVQIQASRAQSAANSASSYASGW